MARRVEVAHGRDRPIGDGAVQGRTDADDPRLRWVQLAGHAAPNCAGGIPSGVRCCHSAAARLDYPDASRSGVVLRSDRFLSPSHLMAVGRFCSGWYRRHSSCDEERIPSDVQSLMGVGRTA